nr:MAG TPA: hypothetical protein [Caudoviricetes sp.]
MARCRSPKAEIRLISESWVVTGEGEFRKDSVDVCIILRLKISPTKWLAAIEKV